MNSPYKLSSYRVYDTQAGTTSLDMTNLLKIKTKFVRCLFDIIYLYLENRIQATLYLFAQQKLDYS